MITHHEAHLLVEEWAAGELAEVRRVWFPSVSPSFEDYQSGYRSLDSSKRDLRLEATGWIMTVLQANKPLFYTTLRRHYVDRKKIGGRARRAALDAFCRAHAAWEFTTQPPAEKNQA